MKETILNFISGWSRLLMAVALMITLSAGQSMSADGIDTKADTVLKSMSDYLGGTKAFSMNADIDLEVVGHNGQKLQFSSSATVSVQRPNKFDITRKGMISDAQFVFDGNTLTIHGKKLNFYYQVKSAGTIDDAIRDYESHTGIPAPGADMLFADTYSILASNVIEGNYIGLAYINGVKCHHLAFRKAKVDWQLWVKAGDQPLPMKYIITSKWITGAPQYEIRFREWNLNLQTKAGQFTFTAPGNAVKLEALTVDDMGEFTSLEENK